MEGALWDEIFACGKPLLRFWDLGPQCSEGKVQEDRMGLGLIGLAVQGSGSIAPAIRDKADLPAWFWLWALLKEDS